jgi:hypothetical protein
VCVRVRACVCVCGGGFHSSAVPATECLEHGILILPVESVLFV